MLLNSSTLVKSGHATLVHTGQATVENIGQNSIGLNNSCGKYFLIKIIALQINLYNNARTSGPAEPS
ncbi:MAG: hypothetical protein IT507_15440 [Burkholderiaceae bacterium]|nr:hypothetical protein [Burkholderiaceae bacterium]